MDFKKTISWKFSLPFGVIVWIIGRTVVWNINSFIGSSLCVLGLIVGLMGVIDLVGKKHNYFFNYLASFKVKQLEGKIWYRLLKVVFIALFVLGVAYIVFISLGDEPIKIIDSEKSEIMCDNGHAWKASALSCSPENIDSLCDSEARKLCTREVTKVETEHGSEYKIETESLIMPVLKNYRINLVTKIEGSWFLVFKNILIRIVFLAIFFETIRRVFIYIILGGSFCKPNEEGKLK